MNGEIEITPDEIAAGFELVEIENPTGYYLGAPEKIKAIVCSVGPSDRVEKVVSLNGYVTYNAKRFGVWWWQEREPKATPDWKPTGFGASNPSTAVQEAKRTLKQADVKIIPRVPAR